eukprot:11630546-Alexandrium_andersonii.AAC.1
MPATSGSTTWDRSPSSISTTSTSGGMQLIATPVSDCANCNPACRDMRPRSRSANLRGGSTAARSCRATSSSPRMRR